MSQLNLGEKSVVDHGIDAIAVNRRKKRIQIVICPKIAYTRLGAWHYLTKHVYMVSFYEQIFSKSSAGQSLPGYS